MPSLNYSIPTLQVGYLPGLSLVAMGLSVPVYSSGRTHGTVEEANRVGHAERV
jgi:hypothetical protein